MGRFAGNSYTLGWGEGGEGSKGCNTRSWCSQTCHSLCLPAKDGIEVVWYEVVLIVDPVLANSELHIRVRLHGRKHH